MKVGLLVLLDVDHVLRDVNECFFWILSKPNSVVWLFYKSGLLLVNLFETTRVNVKHSDMISRPSDCQWYSTDWTFISAGSYCRSSDSPESVNGSCFGIFPLIACFGSVELWFFEVPVLCDTLKSEYLKTFKLLNTEHLASDGLKSPSNLFLWTSQCRSFQLKLIYVSAWNIFSQETWHAALKITPLQRWLMERQILEVLHGVHWTKAHRTESDPPAALSRLAGRLEASAGRWSKPRMCVPSVKTRLCLTAGVSGFQDAVDVLAAFVAERDTPFRTSSCWPAAVSVEISWHSQKRWGHLLVQADFLPPHVPPALIPPRFCCGGPLLLHEGVGRPPGTLWPGRNSDVSPALSEVTAAAGEICCKQTPPSSQLVNDHKICLFNVQQSLKWYEVDNLLPSCCSAAADPRPEGSTCGRGQTEVWAPGWGSGGF